MPTPLASQIQDVLPRTRDAYYKLVLAVGPARTGKTAMLTELAAQHGWPRLNVNLRLSERLLELTHRQRATRVAGILDDSRSTRTAWCSRRDFGCADARQAAGDF